MPPAFLGTLTVMISSAKLPERAARKAFLWELTAYWSCSSRVRPNSSTRFSAVWPIRRLQTGSVRPSHMESIISAWRMRLPKRMSRLM
ncbi:hypothetical protein D3C87_2002830 [compost metagenome]